MSARDTSFGAILSVFAIVISIAIGLIVYKGFSNQQEAKMFLSQGKKEYISISSKKINKRLRIYQSGVPRLRKTYLVSGFINTADNSNFGAVDKNCTVDVSNGQFCMPDYSSGFKMNLESIEMVVTREAYESLKEGDKIEAYCMKVDGNYACKPSTTIKARLN
jgi:hypothetical protein